MALVKRHINELNNSGYLTVPEEGRRIIKEQIESAGEGLPWKDKSIFATLMLEASLETYHKMLQKSAGSLVFLTEEYRILLVIWNWKTFRLLRKQS